MAQHKCNMLLTSNHAHHLNQHTIHPDFSKYATSVKTYTLLTREILQCGLLLDWSYSCSDGYSYGCSCGCTCGCSWWLLQLRLRLQLQLWLQLWLLLQLQLWLQLWFCLQWRLLQMNRRQERYCFNTSEPP